MPRVCTSHAERTNLTDGVRRFTRLTNAFSKSRRRHEAMLALFFARFDFCRRHSAVEMTPAVAAGLADEPCSIERLLTEAAEARREGAVESKPAGQAMLNEAGAEGWELTAVTGRVKGGLRCLLKRLKQ